MDKTTEQFVHELYKLLQPNEIDWDEEPKENTSDTSSVFDDPWLDKWYEEQYSEENIKRNRKAVLGY